MSSSDDPEFTTQEGNIGPGGDFSETVFDSDLINSDGTIDIGLLGERSLSTIAYGIILTIIGYIELIGSGIESWMSGLTSFISDVVETIFSGGSSSSGVVGAIDQISSQTAVWLDPLGVVAYPVVIGIGLLLGIAVVQITIAGIEIILGTNL